MSEIIHKIKQFIGKLNFFDWLVILFLLGLVIIFFVQRTNKEVEWIDVRVKVSSESLWWDSNPPEFWLLEGLEEGDEAYNSFGEKIAVISEITVFDLGGFNRRAYIDVKLKASYDKKKNVFFHNYRPLQIGKGLNLTFEENGLQGLITYIGNDETKKHQKNITVRIKKVEPHVAESYEEGMIMQDSEGKELAEILTVLVKPSRSQVYSDIRGGYISASNGDFREVDIKLEVAAFEKNGTFYLIDGSSLKIGESVWFQFEDTLIKDAEIVSIDIQ